MKRYTAVVVGLGERGKIHLHGLLSNKERFEVIGICDRHESNLSQAAKEYGIEKEKLFTDADTMLGTLNPDVMAFATLPGIRIMLVELAVKYQVKGLMFEKPMATNLNDADYITKLCKQNHIKAVVCQQHKYLSAFIELKKKLDSGELGDIYQITASCQPQASQLGTHYIDYMHWANGGYRAAAVTGHVHGNFYLEDSHPSPDYVFGQIAFENGVRGIFECGYFSRQYAEHQTGFVHEIGEPRYWTDDRLTVYGTKGYAFAQCSGRYGAFTSETASEIWGGDYHDFFETEQYDAQVRYTRDFGEWLENDEKVHPCNVNTAYHGYEILEAFYMSAIERNRIDLPVSLPAKYDALSVLKKKLTRVPYKKF